MVARYNVNAECITANRAGAFILFEDHIKEIEKNKCCGNCDHCYSNLTLTLCERTNTQVKANQKCDDWEGIK